MQRSKHGDFRFAQNQIGFMYWQYAGLKERKKVPQNPNVQLRIESQHLNMDKSSFKMLYVHILGQTSQRVSDH